jgi:antitoxin (DNA-binding transcriptional repressor) of toxin-antitoxin stability system
MSDKLTIAEAARDLSAVVERARASAEGVVLLDGGEPVAKVVSVRPRGKTGREIAASGRLRPRLSPEEAEAFARDIEEGRKFFLPLRDPWA